MSVLASYPGPVLTPYGPGYEAMSVPSHWLYATLLLMKRITPLPHTHTHTHTHTPIVEEYLVEKALVHSLMRKLDLPTYEFPTTRILKT